MDRFIYLRCLIKVRAEMKATYEREIFKLFWVTKCKGVYSFKLEKKYHEKNLTTEYLLSCGKKIMRFK